MIFNQIKAMLSLRAIATITLILLGLSIESRLSVALQKEQPDTRFILINGARPLFEASMAIEHSAGVGISYEDIAWVFSGDVSRAGDFLDRNRVNPNTILPVYETASLNFSIDRNTKRPLDSPLMLLQGLLQGHTSRGGKGDFRIVQMQDDFSIVPDRRKDASGKLVPFSSPLDTLISFPEKERTGMDTIGIIREVVSKASGYPIVLGSLQTNMLTNSAVTSGADNAIARDVLVKALRELHRVNPDGLPIFRTSWALLYDPQSKCYVLNFREVQREVGVPSSDKVRLEGVEVSASK
jgi:hypothetical protein